MKYNFEIPLQGETLTNLKVDNLHGCKNFYVPFKEIKSNGFYIEEMQTCVSHKMSIWGQFKRDGKATLPLDHWIWCSIICIKGQTARFKPCTILWRPNLNVTASILEKNYLWNKKNTVNSKFRYH